MDAFHGNADNPYKKVHPLGVVNLLLDQTPLQKVSEDIVRLNHGIKRLLSKTLFFDPTRPVGDISQNAAYGLVMATEKLKALKDVVENAKDLNPLLKSKIEVIHKKAEKLNQLNINLLKDVEIINYPVSEFKFSNGLTAVDFLTAQKNANYVYPTEIQQILLSKNISAKNTEEFVKSLQKSQQEQRKKPSMNPYTEAYREEKLALLEVVGMSFLNKLKNKENLDMLEDFYRAMDTGLTLNEKQIRQAQGLRVDYTASDFARVKNMLQNPQTLKQNLRGSLEFSVDDKGSKTSFFGDSYFPKYLLDLAEDYDGAVANHVVKQMHDLHDELVDVKLPNISKTRVYEGLHSGISQNNPISFSRFADLDANRYNLPDPRGAMFFPELQSDRYKAVKPLRPKVERIDYARDEQGRLIVRNGNLVEKKVFERDSDGKIVMEPNPFFKAYAEPAYPGMADLSPDLVQQLMIKNAVTATAQRGKGIALFPSTDSDKAELYENIGRNVKQVVKDFGPGFTAQQFDVANGSGDIIKRWGIMLPPDAQSIVAQKGVRFSKGGLVDKPLYDRNR